MVSVYAKQTKDQRLGGARMRIEARGTNRDDLSEWDTLQTITVTYLQRAKKLGMHAYTVVVFA